MLFYIGFAITFVILFALWFAMVGRAWLKTTFIGQKLLGWIEPVEIALYKKSETILIGRLTWLGGGIVTIHDALAVFLASQDWTPITARVLASVPPDMRPVVLSGTITLIGFLMNWLRKRTAKPIEVVAAPATPVNAIAEARVEAANAAAVATVEAEKVA